MRSIRAKLFVSIGSIFLVISVLNYFVPDFFIRRDINSASDYLNAIYSQYVTKLQKLSQSWVTYRVVHQAAQLDMVSQNIQVSNEPLWKMANAVLLQDPNLAIVQVTKNEGETFVISPESGTVYTPSWARDQQGRLWIKIPQKQDVFLAEHLQNQPNMYLLTSTDSEQIITESLTFKPFESAMPIRDRSTTKQMYISITEHESFLSEKSKMIQQLAPLAKKVPGILQVDTDFKSAFALLSEEIFSSKAIIDTNKPISHPFIVYRNEGPYVNLMEFATQTPPYIVIGYSLSSIAKEIALTIRKPVLVYNQTELLQAFSPDGQSIPLNTLAISQKGIIWQNTSYFPNSISIGPLIIKVLTSESEQAVIQRVLNEVRDSLINKLSYNLLTLSILLFIISMISLARISKRLTKPITQLALASEEIGHGKYEGLDLPPVEKRWDEVAILSHSFQKMVTALRDREKIRGVLNKVVSKEIASTILNSNIELGGEERVLTLLFSDIRGFTPLSEILSPQQLIALLNTHMTRMCRIIDTTHGVVDKFVGDEVMALYGAPLPLDNHAEKAIQAAILMLEDLRQWNEERGPNEPQIKVGIGIHTGEACAGNMGAEDRLNYTVVGANVNLAARLCSAALPMQILVSENSYKALPNPKKFDFKKLQPIMLKGIDTPITIYEALSMRNPFT